MVKPNTKESMVIGQNRFDFNGTVWNLITKLTENSQDLEWNKALIGDNLEKNEIRKSQLSWISSRELKKELWEIITSYNEISEWNYDIRGVEDIQYTVYEEGDHYDWHNDCMSEETSNRKISASIFLNDPDEYEGGELDIEIRSPKHEVRYDSFKLPKASIIVFPSNKFHRVRPITSGVRKSLVVWVIGPSFR